MAPSRMLVPQDQEWLSVWGKVLLCTPSKKWWQKCSGWFEEGWLARKRTCHRGMSRSTGEMGGKVVWNCGKSRLNVTLLMQQLGCVFQDMSPPKSILRGGAQNMRKPIQRVKFTKAIARHTKIRDKIFRSHIFTQVNLMSESQRFKIWRSVSGGDRVARARCPRSSVEAGQKCIKSKEHERAAFFSPSENRCLPASILEPEEREVVVHSGALMHMISKKRTWVMLKWTLWRNRAVLRLSSPSMEKCKRMKRQLDTFFRSHSSSSWSFFKVDHKETWGFGWAKC